MKIDIPTTWKLDHRSSVPLNVQLREHIRWSISAGEVPAGAMLPPIRELAQALGVSLNTVKSAYRELQQSGLLFSRRGYGTTVVGPGDRAASAPASALEGLARAARAALEAGHSPEEVHQAVERVLARYQADHRSLTLLFVECDETQLELLGHDIRSATGLRVERVLTSRLPQERERIARRRDRYAAVVTTYFHYREVREAVGDLGIPLLGLVLTTSTSTLEELSRLPAGTTVGCVCRDQETLPSFSSMVQKLLPPGVTTAARLLGDRDGLEALAREAAVLVCTGPALRPLRERFPEKPVFPLYDRVDPASLDILVQHCCPAAREAAAARSVPGE